jgi:hypothetical protein
MLQWNETAGHCYCSSRKDHLCRLLLLHEEACNAHAAVVPIVKGVVGELLSARALCNCLVQV